MFKMTYMTHIVFLSYSAVEHTVYIKFRGDSNQHYMLGFYRVLDLGRSFLIAPPPFFKLRKLRSVELM